MNDRHGALALVGALLLCGCATMGVHEEDVIAWAGRPVSDLDKHPIFVTIPAVRTATPDGTEIRNYVNGANTASCSGGGTAFAGQVNMATYNSFSNCMQKFAACNNIFYIKNGLVERYSA